MSVDWGLLVKWVYAEIGERMNVGCDESGAVEVANESKIVKESGWFVTVVGVEGQLGSNGTGSERKVGRQVEDVGWGQVGCRLSQESAVVAVVG